VHGRRSVVQGVGRAWDVDPLTALNDSVPLVGNSPASAFTPAYANYVLNDITQSGSVYSLVGPWVQIVDWDPPASMPTTTSDGKWTGNRGEQAFMDAMIYLYLDYQQRYLQFLGYTGSSGIQERSIAVDANGANGQDNSYFSPASNRMAFGWGGIPDPEDAQVIFHEYGHAMQYAILGSTWVGGDTGAMGEGFGDYMAFSYRYSRPTGRTFQPLHIFNWDGTVWGGRDANHTEATYRYDPNAQYLAHVGIGDELWSTPLCMAHKELVDQGVSRAEVDSCVIEAHFGFAARRAGWRPHPSRIAGLTRRPTSKVPRTWPRPPA
jgi:hypothetical protein